MSHRFHKGTPTIIACQILDGDTLEDIAQEFKASVHELMILNPRVNWRQINPGQTFRAPLRFELEGGGSLVYVQPGDSLTTVARRYGTTVAAIMQENPHLNSVRFRPGLPLLLPVDFPGICQDGFLYTVMVGDTLPSIAGRFYTTVNAIYQANSGLAPNRLPVGGQICIPAYRSEIFRRRFIYPLWRRY